MKRKSDLRSELKARMDKAQKAIDSLKAQKFNIDRQLQEAEGQLAIWREAYNMEANRLGEPMLPLFEKGKKTYRFAGMRLVDAVALIRKEQPRVNKRKVREMLEKEGFDFRGKNPGQAVHFAWVAVDNRGKRGKKGEQRV